MRFREPLLPARLVRRYKRFLADVELSDGQRITVHCPNTGAMLGCQAPGSRVWLSTSANPRRKYRHTWEIVETKEGVAVGINTLLGNVLVAEALESQLIGELAGFTTQRREVRVDDGRLDFLLCGHPTSPDCYVEVKNVTAAVQSGTALFPDAVSVRATRHLAALTQKVLGGERAALVFCVQRGDITRVRPADEIDPAYGAALRAADAAGVELFALNATVSQQRIVLREKVAIELPRL